MSRDFTPPPPWTLRCPDCEWSVLVFARGAHGNDPGSGVEAAQMLERHKEVAHPASALAQKDRQ